MTAVISSQGCVCLKGYFCSYHGVHLKKTIQIFVFKRKINPQIGLQIGVRTNKLPAATG